MGEWGRGWGQMGTWWTSLAPGDHSPRQHTGGRTLKSGHVNVENSFTEFPIP